jgi:RNA polymerase sigma-70 factor (ECF subfamily)
VAYAVLRDEQRAADVVQQAFVNALRRRRSFRGEGSLEAWVWRIVVNEARKGYAEPRRKELPELEVDGRDSVSHDVRAAILRLPERQRLVLFLRHYADLDYAAIGAALGISEGTVAATLHGARTSLRRSLEEVAS